MAGKEILRNQEMNLCNDKLMLLGVGDNKSNVSDRGFKIEGGISTEWKDIPTELLLQIVSLSGDKMVIVASGVCRQWRDAICSGLTRLSLSWCDKNMYMLVKSLARKFTKLQILILRQGEPQLQLKDDVGVMSLAFGCPDLRKLDLGGCVRITDESVIALADGCPNLRSLRLYNCRKITNRAMYSLANNRAKNRKGLRALNISKCKALTPAAVQALCYSSPTLHTCPGRHSHNEWLFKLNICAMRLCCPTSSGLELSKLIVILPLTLVLLIEYTNWVQIKNKKLGLCTYVVSMGLFVFHAINTEHSYFVSRL